MRWASSARIARISSSSGGVAGGVLVDHVVGGGVLGRHLALGVSLPQIPSPGREPHVEEKVHRLPPIALVAGDLPGEGRALGVTDLLPLLGEGRGHGIGPLEHRPPPGGVRLPADAVAERGKVVRGEEQARVGLGRQGLRRCRGDAGADQDSKSAGQGRPGRKSPGNTHERPPSRWGVGSVGEGWPAGDEGEAPRWAGDTSRIPPSLPGVQPGSGCAHPAACLMHGYAVHIPVMIVRSFRHRGLRLLFESNSPRRITFEERNDGIERVNLEDYH